MEQEVGNGTKLRSLQELGDVLIFALVFAFASEGLLFICGLLFSLVFYGFVVWIQWHEYIGMTITYFIFILVLVAMLHLVHKFISFSRYSLMRGFTGAMALYSIAFPITPISWHSGQDASNSPSVGLVYGAEYQLWPLLTLAGLAGLAILLVDLLNTNDSRYHKLTPLFLAVLALLTTAVSMLVLSVAPETGHIDNWATPFFMLPHVAGLALLAEAMSQYVRNGSCHPTSPGHDSKAGSGTLE